MSARIMEDDRKSLLGWVALASVAAHIGLVTVLPRAKRAAFFAPAIVELAMEVAPPPPAPTSAPTPEAHPVATPRPLATVNAAPPTTARAPAPNAAPANDGPVDFTSTSFSNDGPGLAIGGGGVAPAPAPAKPAGIAAAAAPVFVPVSSLARPPRAPGLDFELERNYPAEARRAGISGRAVLRVEILADGRVGKVAKVSESYAGFGEACSRTVRGARWEPPLDRDGRLVVTEITYVCRFEVRS